MSNCAIEKEKQDLMREWNYNTNKNPFIGRVHFGKLSLKPYFKYEIRWPHMARPGDITSLMLEHEIEFEGWDVMLYLRGQCRCGAYIKKFMGHI